MCSLIGMEVELMKMTLIQLLLVDDIRGQEEIANSAVK